MGFMWIYLFILMYSFVENFNKIDSDAFVWRDLSPYNIQEWLSVTGYAFICHPTLDAVLK